MGNGSGGLVLLLAALVVLIQAQGRWSDRLWGTNIHFTKGRPGETDQLAAAFQVARMDFGWQGVEHTKGVYNWDNFDYLYNSFQTTSTRKVVCYWILDYSNPLYNDGFPPNTTESIQAFVNFAVASIDHFKGKNIIWEMWNEPNGGFWPPKANATAYAKLAYAVGSAIRTHPNINKETFVGPATSTIDLKFLKTCFEAGLLNFFDAVSVHPYRGGGPESVMVEYDNLRTLMKSYAPAGKEIPVLSGEWGWSTCLPPCTPGVASIINEKIQAQYLSRQWLVNALSGVPVSIFYDFYNDGPDPTYREQNFGTLENKYNNASLPHIPKPSYNAAFTLQALLGGWPFLQRVEAANKDPETFVLAFGASGDQGYAIWKTSGHPETQCDPNQRTDCGYEGITKTACEGRGCCFIDPYKPPGPQCYYHPSNTTSTVQFEPLKVGCFALVGMEGNVIDRNLCTQGSQLSLVADDSPRYLLRK